MEPLEIHKKLTDGRLIKKALKGLSIKQLEEIITGVKNQVVDMQKRELEEKKQREAEEAKIQGVLGVMQKEGVTLEQLSKFISGSPVSKHVVNKRPVKYRMTDADGEVYEWTGIGRIPKKFLELKNKGKLDDALVK